MFVLILLSIATIPLSLVLASMAMNAALWLVYHSRTPGLVLEARERAEQPIAANVVALRPAVKRASRAA